MPWDRSLWNEDLFAFLQEFIGLRADNYALRRGTQDVAAWGDDVVMLRRNSPDAAVTLLVNRAAEPVAVENVVGRVIRGDAVIDGTALRLPANAIVVLAEGGERS